MAVPDRRAGVGRLQHRAPARFRRSRAAVGRHADGAVLPQSGSGRRRRRDGGGCVVERHPDRTGAAAFGASGDPVGGRAHPGAPRLSRQGPANGGWTPPACTTNATTRWTTSGGRDGFLRCSLPARPTARPWTSTRWPTSASGWSAASPASPKTARRSLRGRCVTCARFPISRWAGCSTSSTNGRAPTASIATVEPPHRLPPTRVEDNPPLGLDLAGGAIRTIIWATGYRPDYSWLELPVLDRKGHDPCTTAGLRRTSGPVPDGDAVSAPPQVCADRRRRRRRA